MPNYVAINLNVTCKNAEQLNTFLEAIRQDPVPEGHERAVLCFNRIIPMPECLRDTVEGGITSVGYDAWYGDPSSVLSYLWVKEAGVTRREELQAFLDKLSPDYRHQADRAKAAEDATGARSWYHWRLNHWSTMWNAVGPRITDKSDTSVIIKFDTADSVPLPIFVALAVRFPDMEFKGDFLEEFMSFQGTFEKTPDGVNFKFQDVEFDYEEVGKTL